MPSIDIPAAADHAAAFNTSKWKTVILASLGGSLEIYDFIIYGIFAREIASQFFPSTDPLASLLATFGVFAIGYVSRPLGGIVLSSLGDRYGRRAIFIVSILAMSAATIGIGLVPSYATIGILAPALLILLRLIQGFFLAGELPCSITYVVEEMPARASLVSGLVVFCLTSGVFIATLVSLAIHSVLSPADTQSYGWRIAFLVGGALGLVSYFLRTSLEESTEYRNMKSRVAKKPFREILSKYPKQVMIGIGAAGVVNAANSLLFVVLPSYLTSVLKHDAGRVSLGQNLGITVMAFSLLMCAWMGGRIPVRNLHRTGSLLILLSSYPLYRAIANGDIDLLVAFVVIGAIGGIVNGTYAFLLADLFPTKVRFSGIALSLNLATVVFTGLTPLAVTHLMRATGELAAPGIYLAAVALISLVAGIYLKRYGGQLRAGN